MKLQTFAPGALVLALSVAAIPIAHADILYSTGFENPPFTTGLLDGQDGWHQFNRNGTNLDFAQVSSLIAESGSQSVFVDGGSVDQAGPYHVDASSGAPFVELSADIAIFTSTSQSGWQFAGLGSGLAPFLGGIDITESNHILAITNGSPDIGTFTRSTDFAAPVWNHIDLLFDIATQTYDISLNGVLLASDLAFCEDNSTCTAATTTSYADGLFDSFGGGNDSAYMDNYQVASVGSVPEPSAVILLVTMLAGMAIFSRRKLAA